MLTVCHGHAHGVSPNVAVLVPDFVLIFFVFFCFLSLFCNASLQTPSFLVQNSERLRFCTRHFVPELLVSGVTIVVCERKNAFGPKSQICVRETRSGELGTVLPPYAHAFCTRLFLVQNFYQTFASPGTKFWYKLCFTYQTLWYKFFSGTIFLVQFLFLVQKRSGSRSASGARFAFGQRVRPFPICVR